MGLKLCVTLVLFAWLCEMVFIPLPFFSFFICLVLKVPNVSYELQLWTTRHEWACNNSFQKVRQNREKICKEKVQGPLQPFPQASIIAITSLCWHPHMRGHLWLRMGAHILQFPQVAPSSSPPAIRSRFQPQWHLDSVLKRVICIKNKQMKPNSRPCACKITKTFKCLLHDMQTSTIWRMHHQHDYIWSPTFSQKLTNIYISYLSFLLMTEHYNKLQSLASCDDNRGSSTCALTTLVNATEFLYLR